MFTAGAQNLYRTSIMPRPMATREGSAPFTIPQTNKRSISAALRRPTQERPDMIRPMIAATKDLHAERRRKRLGKRGRR